MYCHMFAASDGAQCLSCSNAFNKCIGLAAVVAAQVPVMHRENWESVGRYTSIAFDNRCGAAMPHLWQL